MARYFFFYLELTNHGDIEHIKKYYVYKYLKAAEGRLYHFVQYG